MHPLHDYVAKQLAERLKDRRVVVWYDERVDFRQFVDELRGGPRAVSEPVAVSIAGLKASVAEYSGSLFELRAVVEPFSGVDQPEPLLVYIPGIGHDANASVLMELEKAGCRWPARLKGLAREVLKRKYLQPRIDELLNEERVVSYADLSRAAADDSGAEGPSVLKGIFDGVNGNNEIITAWLASDARDAEIAAKGSEGELTKLLEARLGLQVADSSLSKLRAITLRYVLAGEFRLDLSCDAPTSLDGIDRPPTKGEESAVREIARNLRADYADAYAALADRVEVELGLNNASLSPGSLGAIDTFRFEERALLGYASELVANGYFDAALKLVAEREQSFWLDRDVARKAQWEATRRMAELGNLAKRIRAEVDRNVSGDAAAWLDAYVSKDGWFRLDQAQRALEAWIADLEEDPEERPLAVVRRAYEDTCRVMAEGFTMALSKAGWTIPRALHQTRVWSDVVADKPKPVAYFLVDAMRFEMGVELAERLPKTSEVSVRAAVAALPSITPVGMAALMPGASASFSVVERDDSLGARIEGSFLPDVESRKKHAKARAQQLVDVPLDELLSLPPSKVLKKVEGAQVVLVRSQEIDHAGEKGFSFQARQVMDTVIDNLARAIGKLAAAGIEHAVVSADHGHLFARDQDESMRTDAPGGATVELHRRCWIGRGGATPSGCIRVAASSLGYDSDLEFVFPSGTGVFKSGGDLAFHHGGTSLQELVIPVLTVRTKSRESARTVTSPISAAPLPIAITNRIFSVTIMLGEKQLMLGGKALMVRPLLMSAGRQVGAVGMAVDAEFDRTTGCVKLEPNRAVTVAFLLNDESAPTVRVVVQDPTTDAELYRSPTDIPVRLGLP